MDTALVFAAGDPLPRWVSDDLPTADLVVAANGGFDVALGCGRRVDVLVGDLDSISDRLVPRHVVLERHPTDKDATDMELALSLVAREKPSRLVVAGGGGGRLDHELALAGLICSPRWEEIEEIDWVSGRGRAHVVRRRRAIHGDVGDLVSLIPMHGDARGVTTSGLKWPLAGETLAAGSSRGVSNILESPVADVRVDRGTLLVVLNPPDH